MTAVQFFHSVAQRREEITGNTVELFSLCKNGRTKTREEAKHKGKRMKNIDCCKLMEKCRRFQRCSVPLCPLDQEVENRVYLEGESTCRLDFERLTTIADDGFEEQYRKFIRVSLNKGARFKPLNQITTPRKSTQKTSS